MTFRTYNFEFMYLVNDLVIPTKEPPYIMVRIFALFIQLIDFNHGRQRFCGRKNFSTNPGRGTWRSLFLKSHMFFERQNSLFSPNDFFRIRAQDRPDQLLFLRDIGLEPQQLKPNGLLSLVAVHLKSSQ
jgi:hypothetical protein